MYLFFNLILTRLKVIYSLNIELTIFEHMFLRNKKLNLAVTNEERINGNWG